MTIDPVTAHNGKGAQSRTIPSQHMVNPSIVHGL